MMLEIPWLDGPMLQGRWRWKELEDVLLGGPSPQDVVGWFRLSGETRWIDGLTRWYCLTQAWRAAQALMDQPALLGAPRRSRTSEEEVHPEVEVGDLVRLGHHSAVDGELNWSPEMDAHVGRIATVREKLGKDSQGCNIVRVDLDSGKHVWREDSLVPANIEQLDELQRELTRRLAVVYERYGAAEAEKKFLERLYDAGVLEVRMRLRLTWLLFQGDIEDRDRAERVLVEEGVPVVVNPLPGDYGTSQALEAAIVQLHEASRHNSVLRLLVRRAEHMILGPVAGPSYLLALATAAVSADEMLLFEAREVSGQSPREWAEELFDRLFEGEVGLDSRGIPLFARSAIVLGDRERLWRLLADLFSDPDKRGLLWTLDELLTDSGLLLERAACRFATRVGGDRYEALVDEGRRLISEIQRPELTDLTVEAMLDLIEAREGFRHLAAESHRLVEEIAELQRSWDPNRRPDLRARALYAKGRLAEAWALFESIPQGEGEIEEILVRCWQGLSGDTLRGKLSPDFVDNLPDRVKESGLGAAVIASALRAGHLAVSVPDPGKNDELLTSLEGLLPAEPPRLRVRALDHHAAICRHLGDSAQAAGHIEEAKKLWKAALEAWSAAISQAIERRKPFRSAAKAAWSARRSSSGTGVCCATFGGMA